MEILETTYEVYSPTSVLALFNNALRLPGTENLIHLRGRYAFGGGKSYTNYFYDTLYSEADSISITVKIPALLRSKIVNNEIYTLKGYIEKILRNSRIDINFVVDGIIAQEEGSFSEDDLKKFELIQKKLELGSKDLDTLIRTKLLNNEIVRVANIYGHNAIVQKDFSEGLDVSQKYFEIVEYTCNITSPTSILTQLSELLNLNYDIIALVRGGGDKQSFEVFNDSTLAEYFISLNSISVTAIGHTVNESLLDKLADRRFHLPHDYGAGLHLIVDKLVQEKSNSRALLIDEVKKDISKQFIEQVKTLDSQLKKKNEEFVEAQKTYKEQVENQTKSFNDQLKIRNEEVEKLKKEITETHEKRVRTLSEQLTKKNEEFQKFQESSTKQLQDLQKNFQEQQKQRLEEMANYKREISILHDKNMQSTVDAQTAKLRANLNNASTEITELRATLAKKKFNIIHFIIAVLLGALLGYFILRLI
ncbi:exodeoxyribonuclease VII large subunit [Kaistella sp.]|uniref:exodeoxyribonuclease VII large subunit n=1 Tax=Kaistella sp. TaxID=2782235 RepID=UPI00359F7A81